MKILNSLILSKLMMCGKSVFIFYRKWFAKFSKEINTAKESHLYLILLYNAHSILVYSRLFRLVEERNTYYSAVDVLNRMQSNVYYAYTSNKCVLCCSLSCVPLEEIKDIILRWLTQWHRRGIRYFYTTFFLFLLFLNVPFEL